MLALIAERSLGAIPYFVPAAHTKAARAQLGAGVLLAAEIAYVLDGESERARATAREYARPYLGMSNYTNTLLQFGFTPEDIAAGGSDRLIDAVVPHGTAAEIASVAAAHLDAGADHVALQATGEPGIPRRGWAALAEAVLA
jgi:probable F420-dependent oxidoreductase